MTGLAASGPLLRNGAYVRVWLVGLLTGVVRWLELLAFGVYAYDLTGSPAMVALLVILRFLPLALFGAAMGSLSDRVGPRRLLLIGLGGMALASAALYASFRWGAPSYWLVAAAAFLSGTLWAGDFPLRRRMIGDAVGPARLAGAMALDGAASNGTRMLGPFVGGALYQVFGIEGVFALGAVFYLAAMAITLGTGAGAPRRESGADAADSGGIGGALRHALGSRDIMSILLVTVVFNIWGFPYLSMIPVIGRETLGLSPGAVGAITALEGLFALIAALAIAGAGGIRRLRAVYFGATLVHLLVVLAMGLAPSPWTLALGLAAGGLCTASFAAMQATLIYVVAPPAMRGRFLGLMTICIGAGVLGFANVGLTAELFGASDALWIMALEGLVPILLIGWRWKELRAGG